MTGAGISNWLSDYGTADIPRTKESEFYGVAVETASRERMRALSPITYAATSRRPTLFVHGEADMRVPIEEAEQMYTALQEAARAGQIHSLSRATITAAGRPGTWCTATTRKCSGGKSSYSSVGLRPAQGVFMKLSVILLAALCLSAQTRHITSPKEAVRLQHRRRLSPGQLHAARSLLEEARHGIRPHEAGRHRA